MLEAILFIIILILSVVVHEVSHGYMAYYLGDDTAYRMGRLTLNPLAHLDLFGSIIVPLLMFFSTGFVFGWAKPVPFNPYALRDQKWGSAKVAVVGPLSNILIAVLFAILFRFFPLSTFVNIVLINVVLAVFNLVPIPPLDGSKILFAILPDRYVNFKIGLEKYGFMLVLFLIFFGWPLIRPIINFLAGLLLPI
jgi:Zn-dependent protease